MDLKDIVSRNIIYLRGAKKMTQLELGEALCYSDKAVSKWERGEAVPDAYVLKKLSALFDVSVDYLLNEHDEKELKTGNPHRFNRRIISLISFFGIWTLAVIIFAVLWVFVDSLKWLVFVYTLPISLVNMIVLTAFWGKAKTNLFNISFLVWGVLTAIYITVLLFLQYNWWLLFCIGIPAQVVVILSFRVINKK
ncbi:MAG: helix-turn-helix domain-containing protein [Oscillospiraceae bacterium]|nr:helix-turn-helix domain-containing protein [Oscillospiraceae bacterium]